MLLEIVRMISANLPLGCCLHSDTALRIQLLEHMKFLVKNPAIVNIYIDEPVTGRITLMKENVAEPFIGS